MSLQPLKLEKLILENFYSYGSPTEISFSDGITIIVGENGAGKSSIVKGIYFAILGALPDVTIENAIHRGRNEMRVTLVLTDGSVKYVVTRKRGRRGGAREDTLRMIKDGKERIIATGAEDVTRKLGSLVFLSDFESLEKESLKKLLIDLVILNQGKMEEIGAVLSSNGRDKIEFLQRILGLSAYAKAWESMKDLAVDVKLDFKQPEEISIPFRRSYKITEKDLEEATSTLKQIDDGLERIQKEKERAQQMLQDSIAKERSLLESKKALEKEKASILGEIGSLEPLVSEANKASEKLQEMRRELSTFREKEKKLSEELEKAESIKKQLEDYKQFVKMRLYEEIEKALKSYSDNLISLHKLAEELKISGTLEELRVISDRQLKEMDERIRELERRKGVLRQYIQDQEYLSKNLESGEKELLSLLHNVACAGSIEINTRDLNDAVETMDSSLSAKLSEKKARIALLESSIDQLKRAIEELKTAKGRCPVCGRELDEAHRNELLKKYASELDSSVAELEALKKAEMELENCKKEMNRIRVKLGELNTLRNKLSMMKTEEYQNQLKNVELELEAYSRQKDNLSRMLELHHSMQSAREAILSKLREIEDQALSLENVDMESLEALQIIKERISKQKEQLVSPSSHAELMTFAELKGNIAKLERKLKEIQPEAKQSELASIRERIRSMEEKIAELEEKASQLPGLLERRQQLALQLSNLNESLEINERELARVRNEKGSLTEKLGRLEEQEKFLRALKGSMVETVYKLKVLLRVRSLFDREKGIPPLLMQYAIRALKTRLVESYRRFDLSYDDIRIDDYFNISLINSAQDMEVILDGSSGGEKVAVYLSFIFAAQEVVSELYGGGRRSGFIVLDEPTVNLDETRVRYLADVLREAITVGKGAQIIVVTHDEGLKEAGDTVLRVVKRGRISYVEEENEGF
ncbi:MAG: AAA family ATPase [Fervidicoccaceae archaeon]